MDRSIGAIGEEAVFHFMMDHKDDFVGIDLANDELFSCKPFKDMFSLARRNGLGLTCHAGVFFVRFLTYCQKFLLIFVF